MSWFNESQSGFFGFVGSQNNIGFLSSYGFLVWFDDPRVTDEGWESINVNTELYLDEITFFNSCGVFWEWRVIGADFVNWDTSWEGKSFESGFFVIDFAELFVNEIVAEDAKFDDLRSDCDFFDEFGEDVWIDSMGYR